MKALMKVARNEYVWGSIQRRDSELPVREMMMEKALYARVGGMIPVIAQAVRNVRLGRNEIPRIGWSSHFLAGVGATFGGRK